MADSVLHEEVQKALSDLQSEAKDLEAIAGHELIKLRDAVLGALAGVRAAKRGQNVQEPETEAGVGAVASGAGERHPEAAAAEAQPETAEQLEERADREPDPNVRDKVRQGAEQARAASERSGTSKK